MEVEGDIKNNDDDSVIIQDEQNSENNEVNQSPQNDQQEINTNIKEEVQQEQYNQNYDDDYNKTNQQENYTPQLNSEAPPVNLNSPKKQNINLPQTNTIPNNFVLKNTSNPNNMLFSSVVKNLVDNEEKEENIKLLQKEEKEDQLFRTFASKFFAENEDESNVDHKRITKGVEYYLNKYNYNSFIQVVISVISVSLAIIEYEYTVRRVDGDKDVFIFEDYVEKKYNFNHDRYKYLKRVSLAASYLQFITTILLWLTVIHDAYFMYIVENKAINLTLCEVMGNRSILMKTITKLIILLPSPMPMTYGIVVNVINNNYVSKIRVPLNSIFTCFTLLRLGFILKHFLATGNTGTARAHRLCKLNGVPFSMGFKFKTKMKSEALFVDAFLFIFCLIFTSYSMRIFEREMDRYAGYNFNNYINDLWCIVITMTTVGFGDISPKSIFGRIFALIGCVFGNFLEGLIIVSITSGLEFTPVENMILQCIDRSILIEKQDYYKQDFLKTIYLMWKKHIKKNKDHIRVKDISPQFLKSQNDVVDKMQNLSGIKDELVSDLAGYNEEEEIINLLKFLEYENKKNHEKANIILKNLDALNEEISKLNNKS